MKLSRYAKKIGISYSTALRWFHDGPIKGYQVVMVVKEIASGVNDSRPKLTALLQDRSIT
jgi:predicted site-specific integrase-resolvase